MNYRAGTEEDWPKIVEFLAQWYPPIDITTLGGHWLVAENAGKIRATVWYFMEAPHCYIDYWAGSPCAAARLIALTERALAVFGVRYIRGSVVSSNTAALRLLTKGFNVLTQGNYNLIFKEIMQNG